MLSNKRCQCLEVFPEFPDDTTIIKCRRKVDGLNIQFSSHQGLLDLDEGANMSLNQGQLRRNRKERPKKKLSG